MGTEKKLTHGLARFRSWWSAKSYFYILVILVIGSAALRFYGLLTNLHFDIDEATHTQTIWNIYHNHHLITKGPPASGDTGLYHGAYYYYLYLIPAILGHGNPMFLAVFTILLGIASVVLLAEAVREMYGEQKALLTTFLYVISCIAVIYSRWIWNPNSIPFFTALALFALAKISHKKVKFLPLLAFALGSISQLHVGGLMFVPVAILLIPVLSRITKKASLWWVSAAAFLLPWIPTIAHELRHNFELIRALHNLLKNPSHVSLLHHGEQGYDYFALMFRTIFQAPQLLFLPILLTGCIALLLQLKRRSAHEIVFPYFILITLLFSFITYSFYPGILYLHLSEHLFVLFPILAAFFFFILAQHKESVIAALILLTIFANANWDFYKKDIAFGARQFGTIKHMCQIIKDSGAKNVEIVVNDKINPVYATYLCSNQYGITLGSDTRFSFTTDLRDKFGYSQEPVINPKQLNAVSSQ